MNLSSLATLGQTEVNPDVLKKARLPSAARLPSKFSAMAN